MQLSDDWRPSASLEVLKQRAALLRLVREFFFERDILEVDTPLLGRFGVTDVHLTNLHTSLSHFPEQSFFLQTSPEYAMKRLLAAHGCSIYQLGKVFRDDEVGTHHNPEFTMLEWYRINFSYQSLIDEVIELLHRVLQTPWPVTRYTYAKLFDHYLGIDPLEMSVKELQQQLIKFPHIADLVARETHRDTLLQLAMSVVIEPQLPKHQITVVDSFPASQAALAQLDQNDRRVAHRFEIYAGGLELANGYQELTQASEQQQRFKQDNQERRQQGKPEQAPDSRLLRALENDFPACSGVALGFDRMFMVANKITDIRQAIPFSITCA